MQWVGTGTHNFLRQEGDVLFQQDNARPHMAAATQLALRGVQLPWLARTPDLSPVEHVWDMMKQDLSFSRVCHKHCRIATTGARRLGQAIAG